MVLAETIKAIMDARALRSADPARRMGGEHDHTTFYAAQSTQ